MNKNFRYLALFLILICIIPANAEESNSYLNENTLSGTIRDTGTGNTIHGAVVTASGTVGGTGTYSAQTDETGNYQMVLPVGRYHVTCDAQGYEDTETSIKIMRVPVEQSIPVAQEVELDLELVSDGTGEVQDGNLEISSYMRIGGSTDTVIKTECEGVEWALYNTGGTLKATRISETEEEIYSLDLPGYIHDILVVDYYGNKYALIAGDSEGVIVVDINDPTKMSILSSTKLEYRQDGITFTDGGGTVFYDNVISGTRGKAVDLETDGEYLYIANQDYGIQKTSLFNVLGGECPVTEPDGTLKIDQEKFTLFYAGENPWGCPYSIKFYNGKLFVALSELGLGIFDPLTLEQVGGYNLYTDMSFDEDYFGSMQIDNEVHNRSCIDEITGMPNYMQVSFELKDVMRGDEEAPTPWADLDRYGKYFYRAKNIDLITEDGRTTAYIAYGLGGVVAVDVTGFETATQSGYLTGKFLGFFPPSPPHGKITTGSNPSCILSHRGAGKLEEGGYSTVKVSENYLYATEHFAGVVILERGETNWHNPEYPYNNDFDGIEGNRDPVFECVTSYNMSTSNPDDHESLPKAFYEYPVVLTTGEVYGHGRDVLCMDSQDLSNGGCIDIITASGAGGLSFIDVATEGYGDGFEIITYLPTTDEIGAAGDGSPTQPISIGHSSGVKILNGYLYVADGPHGVTAWKTSENGDMPSLVANTLQDEYPQFVDGYMIFPAPHSKNVLYDPSNAAIWSTGNSAGLRRIGLESIENIAESCEPLILKVEQKDCYEHKTHLNSIEEIKSQDHAYDVAFKDNYAFVADGINGLTVWDITKDPMDAYVGNIGSSEEEKPLLGRATGVRLWEDIGNGRTYAFVACGPQGIGVVDVTYPADMKLVKVFEPIKLEEDRVGAADGKSSQILVLDDRVYVSYDSFGVVTYDISDLIEPLPEGVVPTNIWNKHSEEDGISWDFRPEAISRFKLQEIPEYADWQGAAIRMTYTENEDGSIYFYVGYGEAGVVCLDMTDPVNPGLVAVFETVGQCVEVEVVNGKLYCADGSAGIAILS